jgi:PAS domain S-box-containing protein
MGASGGEVGGGAGRPLLSSWAGDAELFRRMAAAAPDSLMVTGLDGAIRYVNPAFERQTGYSQAEVLGANPRLLKSGRHGAEFYRELWSTVLSGGVWHGRLVNRRKDGQFFEEDATIWPLTDAEGRAAALVAVKRDTSEIRHLESQLVEARKLEAIGQLAAGIAHEINTATQYITDNVDVLGEVWTDVAQVLAASAAAVAAAESGAGTSEALAALGQALAGADLDYLREEVPNSLRHSRDGLGRIAEIVRAMKEFSHPGGHEKVLVDVNQALSTTATVCRNESK